MQKALQGDRIKEIERPFVAKGTPDHPPRHNTRHRVERLESFAFLKEFSGISYQTHSGGKGEHWRFPIEILYKMELAERANFHFVKKCFNPVKM